MNRTNVVVRTRNINSKILFNQVNDSILEAINTSDIRWKDDIHRASLIDVLEEFLETLADDSKITQFVAMCDIRNNTLEELERGTVKLTIKYKQKDCLNTTEITYQIID